MSYLQKFISLAREYSEDQVLTWINNNSYLNVHSEDINTYNSKISQLLEGVALAITQEDS